MEEVWSGRPFRSRAEHPAEFYVSVKTHVRLITGVIGPQSAGKRDSPAWFSLVGEAPVGQKWNVTLLQRWGETAKVSYLELGNFIFVSRSWKRESVCTESSLGSWRSL